MVPHVYLAPMSYTDMPSLFTATPDFAACTVFRGSHVVPISTKAFPELVRDPEMIATTENRDH